MRHPDIIARYGGDEFLVLLPETPSSGAVGVAERIRKTIATYPPITAHGQTVAATVSIGIAGYPEHGANLETVMDKADQAMYASKSSGKNQTTLYSA